MRFQRRVIVEDVGERLRCPDCHGTYRWRPRTLDFTHLCDLPADRLSPTKGPEGERIRVMKENANARKTTANG